MRTELADAAKVSFGYIFSLAPESFGRGGSVLGMSRLVTESAGGEVTVAASGGDHLPKTPVSSPEAKTEVLRLLDQTRVELAEARDLLADSEQRAAEEHELALRLQRAIMPSGVTLLAAAGVDISVRCRPAMPSALVAGDWYDALQLPCGDLLFVVGDIVGHGIEAVTGMVAARNALRGLAATGADPAELLSKLNYGTCLFTEGVTGTVVCGRYTPRSRMLRWARAGHLPPVLIRAGRAEVQPMPEGMLLGAELDAVYEQLFLQLRPDDTLLFYTDGLIERRAMSIADGLAEFAAAAVPADPDLDAHVSRILARAASDTGDDACLMAIRIR
jgi:serine phosphatase RsbU (regulator of sigma subunit)